MQAIRNLMKSQVPSNHKTASRLVNSTRILFARAWSLRPRPEVLIQLAPASLSFLGAIMGVLYGSALEQGNWEKRYRKEQERLVIERRVAIFEKTIILMNKAPVMTGLQASLEGEKKLAELAPSEEYSKHSKEVERIAKEIHVLNSEYAANLSLASLYFCKKTKDAISRLGDNVWLASNEATQRLGKAMADEISCFPK